MEVCYSLLRNPAKLLIIICNAILMSLKLISRRQIEQLGRELRLEPHLLNAPAGWQMKWGRLTVDLLAVCRDGGKSSCDDIIPNGDGP